MLKSRRAGVLLHPTALPGGVGGGDLGLNARRFVDLLAESGISLWQVLPLGPTHVDGSPYQSLSAHAGNPLLIDLNNLVERGWLVLSPPPTLTQNRVADQQAAIQYRRIALQQAFHGFQTKSSSQELEACQHFYQQHDHWLEDFSLYVAIREEEALRDWSQWPAPLRDRNPDALGEAKRRLLLRIEQVKFEQFVFFSQWQTLKRYANQKGVFLFGDMPIFVSYDSAEVWSHPEYFKLDAKGQPVVVAGVPPDYFSATGQRWGNPIYHWEMMQAQGFSWWVERFKTQFEMLDILRIDHFRGFEAYWEIPATEPTAIHGQWVKVPGKALFDTIRQRLGSLPLVAEDLGIITEEVNALRLGEGFPGMKILQFAFDGQPSNPYLPHRHEPVSVVYTGTHDNNTTKGWFEEDLNDWQRHYVLEYLGMPQGEMPWPMIRSALASVAVLAIIPFQDLLELGSAHRFNTPGTIENNWVWRFQWNQVPDHLAQRLRQLVTLYGRS